jgi:hypothetical protein
LDAFFLWFASSGQWYPRGTHPTIADFRVSASNFGSVGCRRVTTSIQNTTPVSRMIANWTQSWRCGLRVIERLLVLLHWSCRMFFHNEKTRVPSTRQQSATHPQVAHRLLVRAAYEYTTGNLPTCPLAHRGHIQEYCTSTSIQIGCTYFSRAIASTRQPSHRRSQTPTDHHYYAKGQANKRASTQTPKQASKQTNKFPSPQTSLLHNQSKPHSTPPSPSPNKLPP